MPVSVHLFRSAGPLLLCGLYCCNVACESLRHFQQLKLQFFRLGLRSNFHAGC